MTSKVTSRVTINAPSKEVFKYLADTNYHILWNPHLHSLNPKKLMKLGDTYKTTSRLLGVKVSGLNKITKLLQNRELQIENDLGALSYKVNYRLQSSGRSITLQCTTEVTARGASFAFTAPILKLLARRELQSDLRALKLAVEQKLA